MITIQQSLLEQSGASFNKEASSSSALFLKTDDGKLPVYPEGFHTFDSGGPEFISSAIEIARRSGGGFLYPFYMGFSEDIVERIGENLELPNGLGVPYLPFISVVGKVEEIKHLKGNQFSLLMPLHNREDFSIVVSAQEKSVDKVETFQVSTANYSEKDYGSKSYIKEMYLKGYKFYKIRKIDLSRDRSVLYRGKEDEKLSKQKLQKLNGKVLVAGINPKRDYFFCDYTFEIGPYTWPSANYALNGNPVVDALFLPD